MTNFEHMKEVVLEKVSAMDEEELMQLCSDSCMDEHVNDVWNCGICEETYGDCLGGFNKGCTNKYLKWCVKEYNQQKNGRISQSENKEEIVKKLSVL